MWGCRHLPKPLQLLGGSVAVKRNLKLWMSNVLLKALPKVVIGDSPGGIWKRMHPTMEITCFPPVTASCCFTELFFQLFCCCCYSRREAFCFQEVGTV